MIKRIVTIFTIALLFLIGCENKCTTEQELFVNTSHLDNLYQELAVEGDTVGIIHIYSEYPDYKWVGDDDEGIACVDDAARAAIFYKNQFSATGLEEHLRKSKMLTRFILALQSENGYFYNFIWEDGSINKTFKTSVAIGSWWSWRALWTMSELYPIFIEKEPLFAETLMQSMNKLVSNIKRDFNYDTLTIEFQGRELPTWLPHGSASDQASIMIIALTNLHNITPDMEVQNIVERLCEGVTLMQAGDVDNFPHYAILSWENIWHAWGNSQSHALLKAGEEFARKDYIQTALNEINYFHKYLLNNNFYNEFKLLENSETEFTKYAQIAYGIRPMVLACLTAAELTGDSTYAIQGGKIATWFFGNNEADIKMYDTKTGICFDGIINDSTANRNSGAESTIEALLTLSAVEKNIYAIKNLQKYFTTSLDK